MCMYLFMGAAALYQYTVGFLGVAGPVQPIQKPQSGWTYFRNNFV